MRNKINTKKIIRFICLFFLIAMFYEISTGQLYSFQSSKKKKEKEIKSFEHLQLGIKFQYYPEFDYFPQHSPADIGTWQQINIERLGISFKSPHYYHASWKGKDSQSYTSPTDSVYELDFGHGVTIEIYESKKKFYEIAFAEDFKQYHKGIGTFPENKWDTIITSLILDSSWIRVGLSGMACYVNYLNGKEWKGIRCESDTRGYSDSEPYSYSAECWFSLMVRPISGNRNLVVFYQDWGPITDESKANPQCIDEQDFYDLVASMKFVKDK